MTLARHKSEGLHLGNIRIFLRSGKFMINLDIKFYEANIFKKCQVILNFSHTLFSKYLGTLTLKAPITTAADDNSCNIFPNFCKN